MRVLIIAIVAIIASASINVLLSEYLYRVILEKAVRALNAQAELITTCESKLPRDQKCVLIAVKDEGNE